MSDILGLLAVWCIVLSGLSLGIGVVLIKLGNRIWHPRFMLLATGLASIFLVFYLLKWGLYGSTHYAGPDKWKPAYYFILITHTLLATLNGPLALVTIANAMRKKYTVHKFWARWTVPIWLYVAATGWIIFVVLKQYGTHAPGIPI